MTQPILILDLGNVVFPMDFKEFDAFIAESKTIDIENFDEKFHKIYVDFERGDFCPDDFLLRLKTELALKFDDEIFKRKWVSIWIHNMVGIDELVSEYKNKLPCYVLSNTNAIHMAEYTKTKPILSEFKKLYLSHDLQCAKPETIIYDKVTKDIGCLANQIYFYDDKPENIESAKDYGWNAFVFKNAEQIRNDLDKVIS
jgi:glucose-1-phosphatase